MYDVVTIGTATRDVFLTSPFFKVLKDPKNLKRLGIPLGEAQCFALGAKITVGPPVLAVGGGAANASITFSRQRLRTAAIIGIGNDPNGEAVLRDLAEEKVKTFPIYDPKEMTGYSVILISSGGERTVLHFRGASKNVKGTESVFGRVRARWAYISPGGIPLTAMVKIVSRLKRRGVAVVMNPSAEYIKLGVKKLAPILKNLDAVIVNREEASYLTGFDYAREKAIFSKFDELVSGIAVMTDGRRGASVSDGKYIYRAGIFPEKSVVDRTGAGDAFGSGFVAGLIQKNDILYALRLASANATSVVEKVGAQAGILTKSDFKKKRWQYLDLDVEPL